MKKKNGLHSLPKTIQDPALPSAPGLAIAVLPNNKRILTSGLDFHIRLWDIEAETCINSWDARGPIFSMTVDQTAGIAILGAVQGIVLWDLHDWDLCEDNTLWSHSLIEAVAYCENTGEVLGVGEDTTIHRWHLHRREKIGRLPGHQTTITAVDLDPTGCLAVTGDLDGELRLWDLENNVCLKKWQGHSKKVSGLALAQGAQQVLSGSADGALILWDLPSGEAVRELRDLRITSVALSKDARHAFSCCQDGLSHWDLVRGYLIARYPQEGIEKIALSADNVTLAGLIKSNHVLGWDCSLWEG